MAVINELNQAIQSASLEQGKRFPANQKNEETVSFSDTIKGFLTAVNNSKKEAAGKVADIVEGKSENLAEAMTAMEESKLNFQLLLEVRSRLLDSYKEIQRMQV